MAWVTMARRPRPSRAVAGAALAAAAAATATALIAAVSVRASPLGAAPVAAAALPRTVRAFEPSQLGGVFTRFIEQGACPETIEHTGAVNAAEGVFNVPFDNILMDGEACTSAGSMLVLRNSDSRLAGQLSELLTTNPILADVYGQLVEADAGFLVGFETIDRVCGASTFEAPTVTFFISEESAVTVPQVAFLRPESRPYMVVFSEGSPNGIPCTYSAVGSQGATPVPEGDDDDDDTADATPVVVVPAVVGDDDDDDDDTADATPIVVVGTGTPDVDSIDDDNDGIPDPSDPDDDNDGLPDNADSDNDGDGIADINDIPRNDGQDDDEGARIEPATGGEDTDSIDDDNDGIPDPSDPDDDNDGRPDNADANDDGDGVADVADTPRNDGQDDGETAGAGTGDATDQGAVGPDDVDGDGEDADAEDGDAEDGDADDPVIVTGVDEPEPSDDDSVCFPASATVELDSGRHVTMDQLAVGDNVRVSADAFSRVFLFTHKIASGSFRFVKLSTASAASLTVTRSHYIYANGKMTAAGAVTLGDKLELVGESKCDIVTAIAPVTETGLYNPQTLHGDIVVNGFRASTYTMAVEPTLASALLSPLRALFRATGLSTSALDAGSARLAALLPSGASVY